MHVNSVCGPMIRYSRSWICFLFSQDQAGPDGNLMFSQSKLERYTVQYFWCSYRCPDALLGWCHLFISGYAWDMFTCISIYYVSSVIVCFIARRSINLLMKSSLYWTKLPLLYLPHWLLWYHNLHLFFYVQLPSAIIWLSCSL